MQSKRLLWGILGIAMICGVFVFSACPTESDDTSGGNTTQGGNGTNTGDKGDDTGSNGTSTGGNGDSTGGNGDDTGDKGDDTTSQENTFTPLQRLNYKIF
jgi:hypothetical protein